MVLSMRLGKPLISCEIGPNYTVLEGLKSVLEITKLPFTYKNIDNSNIDHYFSQKKPIYFVDSGRTALYLLLKSLDLPAESEVLIQGFSCVVVPNSVWQAGLKPILVDIEKENYNISVKDCTKKITKKTKVLVVQYPFGIIPNLDEIVTFCEKNKIMLIEDCAHSFGAFGYLKGKQVQVGSIGYGAVFSFGRDKVISSTMGGVAVLNSIDQQQISNFEKEYSKLKAMSFTKQFQSLVYISLSSLLIRPFYHFGVGKLSLVCAKKLKVIGDIYSKSEKKGTNIQNNPSTFPISLSNILLSQLKQFPTTQEHRKTIAKIYCNCLNLLFNETNSYLRFPISCNSTKEYEEILAITRQQGVILGTWYNSLFIPKDVDLSKFNYKIGDLPICEELINKKILNLPTNIHVSKNQAKHLIQLIILAQKRQLR
jgi:perosamine synthetase